MSYWLPLLEWCEIPAGTVIIEGIVYRVRAFRMAKYPITCAQFAVFIEADDGYFNPAWWQGLPRPADGPGEPRWPDGDHPRQQVNWHEAIAFCRWLSDRKGIPIRLPTEQEWQRAAQGDDQRPFPWGERYDDTSRCNTRETGLMHTTPVGQFPKGNSPYGVWDMAGNVWEWCLNEYEHPARVGLSGRAARVLRGGSWFSTYTVTDTTVRYFCLPHIRDFDLGFRVVCAHTYRRDRLYPDYLRTGLHLTRQTATALARRIARTMNRI